MKHNCDKQKIEEQKIEEEESKEEEDGEYMHCSHERCLARFKSKSNHKSYNHSKDGFTSEFTECIGEACVKCKQDKGKLADLALTFFF